MDTIKLGFYLRKPWVTQFTINNKNYGGKISFDNDSRIVQFFDCFPNARTILDLGSLEGGQSFQLAKRPGTSILGIEGRKSNIDKANYVKGLLGIDNVSFKLANLENTPLSTIGPFDAVFCSGLLYHLPKPWELIQKLAKISDDLFVWTHYAKDDDAIENVGQYKGYYYQEFGTNDPLSGLSDRSFRMTRDSLIQLLNESGYTNIKIYEDNPDHPHGACITLGTWK